MAALNLVFGITLAAGVAVLFAVMQSSHDTRMREAAMLKVLGCDYSRLTRALNTEFVVIGVVAGIIAAVAATLTGWLLATRVLDLEYAPQLSVIAISILVSLR